MDEIDDIVRASLSEAIDAEFSRHDERTEGGPIPNFDVAAFTLNFEAEPLSAGLFSDNEDTEDHEEKNTSKVKEFCRMCLCDDRKLSSISPQNRVAFQCVLRQDEDKSNDPPRISQKVCFDCNTRMTSFRMFRTKAIQTNTLLYSLIRPFMSVSEQTSTTEGTPRSELLGLYGNSRCLIRRQGRSQPYNLLTDDPIPFRQHRLSFCVLQRQTTRPGRHNPLEPRQPE